VGDYGETNPSFGCNSAPSTTDDDIFLLRTEGLDYSTGQVTNPGNDDNISIIEYDCISQNYPATYSFGTNQVNTHTFQFGSIGTSDFAIADVAGVGYIDTMAIIDGGVENLSYTMASSQGTWGTPQQAYFGPYILWAIAVEDLNGDSEFDFVNSTIAY
jgi:hypothetical protein